MSSATIAPPVTTDAARMRELYEGFRNTGFHIDLEHCCKPGRFTITVSREFAASATAPTLVEALEQANGKAVTQLVEGLSSLTVSELVEHLDLERSPHLSIERMVIAEWATVNGFAELQAALVAVDAQEATR